MTLLYACRTFGNYRGASCELDVAVDYIFVSCALLLQLAVTIMASFCRHDGSTAANKGKMSLYFQWVRRGFQEECGKVPGAQARVCFWHGVWRGASCRPYSWIRHGLRELPGCPLSICHLHAWPKPWKMTGEGVLQGIQSGIQQSTQRRPLHAAVPFFTLGFVVQHSN